MEVSGQINPPWRKDPGTHWIGGWVGPTAGLNAVDKRKKLTLLGIEPWPSSTSLYWMSYPGSHEASYRCIIIGKEDTEGNGLIFINNEL
jgi:hypothetical protein